MSSCLVSEMIGKTFSRVEHTDTQLSFWSKEESYCLVHDQDCCENVYLEEIIGDLKDLENNPILVAEESASSNLPAKHSYDESWTWTFYKFATIKGSVTLRWYGTSNGYYSEAVSCHKWTESDISEDT